MLKHTKSLLNSNALWLAIVVTISIIVLSLVNLGAAPINFNVSDKIQHTVAYTVLSFLWLIVFRNYKKKVIVIAACIVLGIILEYLQGQTGYRYFEVNDMLANTIGVLLGMLFSNIYLKK